LFPAFLSQFCNTQSNFLEDPLMSAGILTIGILDIPILDPGIIIKSHFPGVATHVDDDVYLLPNFGRDARGLQIFHPASVSYEGLLGQLGDKANGRQARAKRVDGIVSINARDCLCHRTAAGIPDTNEQDLFAAVFAHQEVSLKPLVPNGWGVAPRSASGMLLNCSGQLQDHFKAEL
jgi:hypothetical protein